MKKKIWGIVVGLVAVIVLVSALVILGRKDVGVMSEAETETIAQEDNIETIVAESEAAGNGETEDPIEEQTVNQPNAQPEEQGDNDNQGTKATTATEQETAAELESIGSSSSQPPDNVDTTLGDDLTYEESIPSNSGVNIPVLNKFNSAGLNPDCANDDMQDWFGYVGDSDSPGYVNVTVYADAMNELTEAMNITGGFLPQQEYISFSFTDIYASTSDLKLRRDFENGYYTIGINYDMSDSESFYPVEDGKDALTLLCSVISSTPSELSEFLYQESFVVEESMTSEDTWVAVGDCLVQWGGYNSSDGDVLIYKIKAK